MKEIIEVIESRIKSPIYGYFLVSFIAINWRAIFYLAVEEKGALERITYFDSHTDIGTLIILPTIAACVLSLVYPWISYTFLYLCRKPTELRNTLQAHSEHKLLIKRQELEKLRTKILSDAEMALIDRAKRDTELNKIEDVKIKEQLKAEIDQLRNEKDRFEKSVVKTSENHNPNQLIEIAATFRQRADSASDYKDRERLIKQASNLEEKAHEILIMGQ